MAKVEKIDPLTLYSALPVGTTVLVHFKHNGHPFRIKFRKDGEYSSTVMHAYPGETGEMNNRNRIEYKYVSTYSCTLHDCIALRAKSRFDIEPTDIEFTMVVDPAN